MYNSVDVNDLEDVSIGSNSSASISNAIYGKGNDTAKIAQIEIKIGEIKTVLEDNITKSLERGESLDEINIKTDAMLEASKNLYRDSNRLKRKMCSRVWKVRGFICLTLSLIIGVVVLLAVELRQKN